MQAQYCPEEEKNQPTDQKRHMSHESHEILKIYVIVYITVYLSSLKATSTFGEDTG